MKYKNSNVMWSTPHRSVDVSINTTWMATRGGYDKTFFVSWLSMVEQPRLTRTYEWNGDGVFVIRFTSVYRLYMVE